MRSRWGNAAFCEGTGKCVPAEENDRKHDFSVTFMEATRRLFGFSANFQ